MKAKKTREKTKRNIAMYEEFKITHNKYALAKKYKLKWPTVHNIINRMILREEKK